MKSILFIVLSFIGFVHCQEFPDITIEEDDGSEVVISGIEDDQLQGNWIIKNPKVITTDFFDEKVVDPETLLVREGNPWFIMFYAPWCNHCKKMAPLWENLNTQYGDEVNIGKIDCTSNDASDICEQFGVSGYPTLLFFMEDKTYEYQYQRDIEIMYQFTQGGYSAIPEADMKPIPARLKGADRYTNAVMIALQQIGKTVDRFFDKLHLKFVPSIVRYSIAAFFFLAPMLGFCIFLIFGEYEQDDAASKKDAKAGDKTDKKDIQNKKKKQDSKDADKKKEDDKKAKKE